MADVQSVSVYIDSRQREYGDNVENPVFLRERSCFYEFVYSTETMLFLYFSFKCESHSLNWEARRDLTVADNYYSATKNCCQMFAHFRVYKISSGIL